MWQSYYAPGNLDGALELLARHDDGCRPIAGGTDLILEIERGVRSPKTVVDLSRILGLDCVEVQDGHLVVGATATHNQVVANPDAVSRAFPLAHACWQVGAPQIRNRGTVVGNLVTASPANDTISPLWALDATVTLVSQARGERTLTFPQFFQGVRRTALAADELVARINVPLLGPGERGTFLKLGLRQAQAISVVNVSVTVDSGGSTFDASAPLRGARIALGAVAPTIVRATDAEAYLAGKVLSNAVIARAATLAAETGRPISDIRGSAEYRKEMTRVLVARALTQLRDGTERADWPAWPVLLWGGSRGATRSSRTPRQVGEFSGPVRLTVNGKALTLAHAAGKTLLRALREDAGLTGTKEGCAEGECGACTVWLDGVAVMSCLVPAERADGCDVVTIEGLAPHAGDDHDGVTLHPLQQAFVDTGAVQCGYCTPGILMSAANLLDEVAHPTPAQVKEALTGNLCRCTGYYRILEAVERAAAAAG